jgi:hypothetical protein
LLSIAYAVDFFLEKIHADLGVFVEVFIRLNVINIPFTQPFQSDGFDSLPEIVDAACYLNH